MTSTHEDSQTPQNPTFEEINNALNQPISTERLEEIKANAVSIEGVVEEPIPERPKVDPEVAATLDAAEEELRLALLKIDEEKEQLKAKEEKARNDIRHLQEEKWGLPISQYSQTKDMHFVASDDDLRKYPMSTIAKLTENVKKVKEGNKPIRIKPVGNQREEFSIDEMSNALQGEFTLMQQAKSFFEENKKDIEKQLNSMVALYNIGSKKPFYFISPQEARVAIDHIKDYRDGSVDTKKAKEEKDAAIDLFPATLPNIPKKLEDIAEVTDERREEINNQIKMAIAKRRKVNETYSASIINECPDGKLTLQFINWAMGFAEQFDITVNGILMNSKRFSDVRNWGQTVYSEKTSKEIEDRKKEDTSVIADLFTAEIYRCNALADDQVILYNHEVGAFFNVFMKPMATIHSCNVTTLKDQPWWNKLPPDNRTGLHMFAQHISSYQVEADNGDSCEAANVQRGAVAEIDVRPKIYDIAVNPRPENGEITGETYKDGFLAILREKATNDMIVFEEMMEHLTKNGKVTDEDWRLNKADVAATMLSDFAILGAHKLNGVEFEEKMKARKERNTEIQKEVQKIAEKYKV